MKTDKELYIQGQILKAISPLPYENVQRVLGPLSTKVLSVLPLKSLNCTKTTIKRSDGTEFRVCVMKGKKREGKAVGILWLHGGGYSLGAPEMAIMSFPRHLINNCNCVVVAPDYTLSTEKPYPAALEDAYTSLQWLKDNYKQLGIECDKFVVGGESAGGGLCAALCIYARDKGNNCIAFQMPLYPMLDDKVTSSSANNNAPVWNTKANKSAWKIYLGDSVMNNSVESYAAPARETDFKNLPPAISIIGDIEPFYDETVTFFNKLKNADTDIHFKIFKGAYHAFDMMAPYTKISKSAYSFLLNSYNDFVNKYINKKQDE